MSEKKILRIMTSAQLRLLAKDLRVRPDWHEPDEQGLEAIVFGEDFDNAGFWGRPYREDGFDPNIPGTEEMSVMLVKDGEPIAEVNLATLFSMACGWSD